MLKKRIIPCLDIANGRTVKGINFKDLIDAGDPIELAKRYVLEGADELVFLDITATVENRKTRTKMIKKIAAEINIPFTVGGGITSLKDAAEVIEAGADKISLNSAAVKNPEIITQIQKRFGSQCIVLAIDTQYIEGEWRVVTHGGRKITPLKAVEWAQKAEQLGAGEILLTSMNNDGTKDGFAVEITDRVSQSINIPLIASGGAGCLEDFSVIFKQSKASAALAASVFHFNEIPIPQLKKYLLKNNISIR